jgi:hypothetical protein
LDSIAQFSEPRENHQDQKDKLDWKNHDIITEFKKEADNIRSRVLYEECHRKKEASPERNTQILHESGKNRPPPVKPGRLARFSKFFGLASHSELDFDNIAQFSEPRENRCTYV